MPPPALPGAVELRKHHGSYHGISWRLCPIEIRTIILRDNIHDRLMSENLHGPVWISSVFERAGMGTCTGLKAYLEAHSICITYTDSTDKVRRGTLVCLQRFYMCNGKVYAVGQRLSYLEWAAGPPIQHEKYPQSILTNLSPRKARSLHVTYKQIEASSQSLAELANFQLQPLTKEWLCRFSKREAPVQDISKVGSRSESGPI